MIKLKNQFMLAPMVGVTDIAFRILCRRHGAGMASVEMIAANAIIHSEKVVKELIHFNNEDRPIALQLMGTGSEIVKAAKKYEDKIDVLDINMGCPSKTVTKLGAGSALLLSPDKIRRIVKECSSKLSIPVTVKIRAGYNEVNVIEIAKICEENGASAISVHGRTKTQGYRGLANWGLIKEVKDNVSIPLIGNGDVKKPEDALNMIEKTGCDYVMIARAAMGNPDIFSQILEYEKEGKYKTNTRDDKINMVYEYLELAHEFDIPFPKIKTNVHGLTSGISGSKRFRLKINPVEKTEEIVRELNILHKI